MTALSSLTSSGKKRKRVGRGGSRGGTSGKGHKGQKARSGPKIAIQFEGGQMPLTRRLPKRGFTNARFKQDWEIVNIKSLETTFDSGATVTPQALYEKGLIRGGRRLVKILGDGELTKKLSVQANKFSKAAADTILQAGGEVHEIPSKAAESPAKRSVAAKKTKKISAPSQEVTEEPVDVKES